MNKQTRLVCLFTLFNSSNFGELIELKMKEIQMSSKPLIIEGWVEPMYNKYNLVSSDDIRTKGLQIKPDHADRYFEEIRDVLEIIVPHHYKLNSEREFYEVELIRNRGKAKLIASICCPQNKKPNEDYILVSITDSLASNETDSLNSLFKRELSQKIWVGSFSSFDIKVTKKLERSTKIIDVLSEFLKKPSEEALVKEELPNMTHLIFGNNYSSTGTLSYKLPIDGDIYLSVDTAGNTSADALKIITKKARRVIEKEQLILNKLQITVDLLKTEVMVVSDEKILIVRKGFEYIIQEPIFKTWTGKAWENLPWQGKVLYA
jgi:hypothetical protein